ncbi:hypothetical protein C0Q70_00103 [Pomacea canaliculata]|uniref:Caspase family p20 domain-containing protein n=1 Tax=Pomacea canaliculata TaxID=400727 RepID=A0A2T7PVR9_POMCA|nr:hypothetical protein C0Q70_00103 [Pomacea canaliculata]
MLLACHSYLSSASNVTWSGKKERPLNMATTDDKEDGSRTEVSPIVEDPDEYNFSHSRRGLALIIDNENFTSASRLPSRQGSDKDLTSLGDMFNRLGFEVEGYKDLKGEDMWKVLTEVSKEDHSDADCFACAILSHGEEGYVYGQDARIEIEKLVGPFKGNRCKSLAAKPKLFFIQACRGTNLDDGVKWQMHWAQRGEQKWKFAEFLQKLIFLWHTLLYQDLLMAKGCQVPLPCFDDLGTDINKGDKIVPVPNGEAVEPRDERNN